MRSNLNQSIITNPSPVPAQAAAASRGLAVLIPVVLIAVALGCAYGSTLAPGITWANDGADSGDLVTAAATLGVAHPTGYPTYLLLTRLFQLIPLGDPALNSTIFSAVAAVLAALVVYRIAQVLLGELEWRAIAAAGTAALAIGLAPVFWSQAVIAEVYSLNALFIALILLFTLQVIQKPLPSTDARKFVAGLPDDGRWTMDDSAIVHRPSSIVGTGNGFLPMCTRYAWATRGEALIVGLAMGNHITAAGAVAAWFGMAAIATPRHDRGRLIVQRALWVGVGLLVYLYLPLRAAAQPPVNWGDPRDWSGFWWEISGQPYRDLAFGLPTNLLYGRVAAWATLLVQQFSWLGVVIGFFGLLYGAPNTRRFVWLSAAVAAAASIFAIVYNTGDSYAYLIPAYLIFAIWIGLGIDLSLRALARLHVFAAPIATAGLLTLLVWRAISIAPQVDASQDRRAIVFAASVLASAPRNAIVVSDSDLDTFPIWYYHYALGARPDLAVIVDPLLEFDWYRRNLRAVYPDLQIPPTTDSSWLDAIAAVNPQRANLCRTQITAAHVLNCTPLPAQP